MKVAGALVMYYFSTMAPRACTVKRICDPSSVPRANTQLGTGSCLLQHIRKWEYISAVCQMVQESAHNAVLCPVPYIISDTGPVAYVTPSLTAVSTTQPTHTTHTDTHPYWRNALSHTFPSKEMQFSSSICFACLCFEMIFTGERKTDWCTPTR